MDAGYVEEVEDCVCVLEVCLVGGEGAFDVRVNASVEALGCGESLLVLRALEVIVGADCSRLLVGEYWMGEFEDSL